MPWTKRWFQISLLMFLAFIWGSSFILMKIGLKSFSSPQTAAIRIFTASLVLLPYGIKNLKTLKRKDVFPLLVAGFVGSFIPAFLFTKAQTRIDSALAGMLNSLTPIFTLIVGVIFHRTQTGWKQILGLLLGLIGALGLIASGKDLAISNINSYAFFIVIATSCYAFNVNIVKARLTHLSGIQITSLSFLFVGPAALAVLLTSDIEAATQTPNWLMHFGALSLLGIVGTALAMLLMNSLIRYVPAVLAASVTYIIPIYAILWGLLDNEVITYLHILFMAVVLFGVYLINKK